MANFLVDKATGVVVNSIICDAVTAASNWQPPAGFELVEFMGACDIGWIWNGTTMTNPAVTPVPIPPISPSTTTVT